MPGPTPRRLIPPSCGHRTFTKDTIDTSKLPLSYQSNTLKEEHLLQVADNFSRQYSHLCPDRVPLFLHPLNECEVPVRLGGRGQGRGRSTEGGRRAKHSPLLEGGGGQHINSNATGPSRPSVRHPCGGLEPPCPRGQPCAEKGRDIRQNGPGPECWPPSFPPWDPGHVPDSHWASVSPPVDGMAGDECEVTMRQPLHRLTGACRPFDLAHLVM